MATLVRVTVPDPQNVIDTYGTGALYRIERDTTSAMSSPSEVTTGAVVAGTTEYEYRDQTGVAGTHYYRTRFSKASPSVAADYSGYSPVMQAGEAADYTTLEAVRMRLGIPSTSTADDGVLAQMVNAANAAITARLGFFYGPTGVTLRLFHGYHAVNGGTQLWVPGGIRTLTAIRIAEQTGASLASGTLADYLLLPSSSTLRPGEAYPYVQISDQATGSYTRFPAGWDNIELTGTFGPSWVPDDLAETAAAFAVRLFQARQSGQRGVVNVGVDGFASVYPFLTAPDKAVIDQYRFQNFGAWV